MFRANTVKRRLAAGEPVFGVMHSLAHAPVAELLGLGGCDFVIIDGEHGQGGHQDHLACLQALSSTPAHSIVRVSSGERDPIKRILDIGAEGVMVPNLSTADQARAVVAACRYPLRGVRGYAAGGIRASDYGLRTRRYLDEVESELLVAVIIETAEGVRNIADIAAVDGIDVIQVGANDLSYDMGIPEELAHPDLHAALAAIESATLAAGKVLGGVPLPGISFEQLIARGYRLITIGRDTGFLLSGLAAQLKAARPSG